MYLFDLQAKLKRVNPNLVVLTDKKVEQIDKDNPSFPLVLKWGKRDIFHNTGKKLMDDETQKYIEMKENGQAGQFICGIPKYIPEYDQFELEYGKCIARGWRGIAMLLVKKGVCTLSQVRKVFGSSLGEASYDSWTYEQKILALKKESQDALSNTRF